MATDGLTLDLRDIRGTDSNTLLRLYDQAHGRLGHFQSQQEKTRVERALERIRSELRKRKVEF
jgi:hypothetical protein